MNGKGVIVGGEIALSRGLKPDHHQGFINSIKHQNAQTPARALWLILLDLPSRSPHRELLLPKIFPSRLRQVHRMPACFAFDHILRQTEVLQHAGVKLLELASLFVNAPNKLNIRQGVTDSRAPCTRMPRKVRSIGTQCGN